MLVKNFILVSYVYITVFGLSRTHFLNENTVRTPSGDIQGQTNVFPTGLGVTSFRGIPFAKPPTGDLRFKKPFPVEPWKKKLDARYDRVRPGCMQYSPDPFPWVDNLPGLSEDCLYLNIWVPSAKTKTKRSVMFWIHTGGFRTGSSRVDYYDGTVLAAVGDVIVVTTNYRLGIEGFLYSGTDDAPGNMGLWDLVESLKWVRNNIESFGGDKDSITLFGHGSGAIAVGMFCTSPVTRGLFRRAIMQSGAPTNFDGEDNNGNFKLSQQLAQEVGCADNENGLRDNPHKVVECLRNVTPFLLARVQWKVTANSTRHYYPQFGDELLPKNPRQAIIDGDFSAVDLLIGSNNGDGATLITKPMKDVFGFFGEKNPQINLTFGKSIIREQFKTYDDPDAVVRQYLGGFNKDDYETIRRQVFQASGDFSRVCPSVYFAESFAKKGAQVFYYFLTRHSSIMPWAPWMLAVHFDDIPFVFGHLEYTKYDKNSKEQLLHDRMCEAWSTFAKIGIPSAGLWPLYSKEDPTYQKLDVDISTSQTGLGPHRSNCDFFRRKFGFLSSSDELRYITEQSFSSLNGFSRAFEHLTFIILFNFINICVIIGVSAGTI